MRTLAFRRWTFNRCYGCDNGRRPLVGQTARGYYCSPCWDALTRQDGHCCQVCKDHYRQTLPDNYDHLSFDNHHAMTHSDVIGHCVDTGILAFLEGFNQHVAPTSASCEGDGPNADRDAYVLVDGKHKRAVFDWFTSEAHKYPELRSINATTGQYPSIRLSFRTAPTGWL